MDVFCAVFLLFSLILAMSNNRRGLLLNWAQNILVCQKNYLGSRYISHLRILPWLSTRVNQDCSYSQSLRQPEGSCASPPWKLQLAQLPCFSSVCVSWGNDKTSCNCLKAWAPLGCWVLGPHYSWDLAGIWACSCSSLLLTSKPSKVFIQGKY